MHFMLVIQYRHGAPVVILHHQPGLQQRLVQVGAGYAAFHHIANLEIEVVNSLWRLNLVALKHETDLWFEFPVARSLSRAFSLELKKASIGISGSHGIHI